MKKVLLLFLAIILLSVSTVTFAKTVFQPTNEMQVLFQKALRTPAVQYDIIRYFRKNKITITRADLNTLIKLQVSVTDDPVSDTTPPVAEETSAETQQEPSPEITADSLWSIISIVRQYPQKYSIRLKNLKITPFITAVGIGGSCTLSDSEGNKYSGSVAIDDNKAIQLQKGLLPGEETNILIPQFPLLIEIPLEKGEIACYGNQSIIRNEDQTRKKCIYDSSGVCVCQQIFEPLKKLDSCTFYAGSPLAGSYPLTVNMP